MNYRRVAVLIASIPLFSLFGCAVQLADVKPEIPDLQLRDKFPLRAALVIRKPAIDINTVTNLPSDCIGQVKDFSKYPLGPVFQDVAKGVFSQVFERLDAGQHLAVRKDYDLIVEADLTGVYNRTGCMFRQKSFVRTEGVLRLRDGNFEEFWVSEQNSADTFYDPGVVVLDTNAVGAAVSEAISGSLGALVRGWVQELQQGYVLHKYARAQKAPSLRDEHPSRPAIGFSDVDELPVPKAQEQTHAFAVVVGIEEYRQKVPNALYAVRDAKAVTDYLTKVLGYPESNVVTLTNEHAAKSDLEKYFEKWLPNNLDKDSRLFVYYSGHGAPDPRTGDAYLLPFDGDPAFIEQTGYSLKRLYDHLGKLPVKEVIVALDACFSGGGSRSVVAQGARPLVMNQQDPAITSPKIRVLAASSMNQISSTYDEKGHGLFTYFMLKGVKNEEVVRQDGSLEIKDLFNYVKPQVQSIARKKYNNEQTPQLIEGKRN